jgi:phosphoribosyl-dephospho-CoA transferase
MSEDTLARHQLAWLTPAACGDAQLHGRACVDATAARLKLAEWVAAGLPLFVTRQPAEAEGRVALGLALPPQRGKFRLGFLVEPAAISRFAKAPALAEAIDDLPPAWRPKAAALLAVPAIAAAQPRVYGSAAMQIVSGEPCLSASSDLDLSFAPTSWPAACAVVAALAKLEAARTGPRVDGEIAAADGGAVAWRELLGEPDKLLVKRLHSVGLETLADFRAAFAPSERCAA